MRPGVRRVKPHESPEGRARIRLAPKLVKELRLLQDRDCLPRVVLLRQRERGHGVLEPAHPHQAQANVRVRDRACGADLGRPLEVLQRLLRVAGLQMAVASVGCGLESLHKIRIALSRLLVLLLLLLLWLLLTWCAYCR